MTYTHKNQWIWGKTHTVVWWNGVGLVNVSVENETPELATIHGISVLPTYRKRGYGTKLLHLAENEARKMGATRVCLATEPNSWLEEWYKSLGYEFDSYNEDNLIVLLKNLE